MFIFGFTLGYVVVIPATARALVLFTKLLGLNPVYGFSDFFSVAMMTLLLCGFIFAFSIFIPVVLLMETGILITRRFEKQREQAEKQ